MPLNRSLRDEGHHLPFIKDKSHELIAQQAAAARLQSSVKAQQEAGEDGQTCTQAGWD